MKCVYLLLFVIIPIDFITKVFKYLKIIKHMVVNTSSPKFKFSHKTSNIVLAKKYCHLFAWKSQGHFICFQENVYQIPKPD